MNDDVCGCDHLLLDVWMTIQSEING